MTEDQKGPMVTGNPAGEQNQVKKTNEDNQQKSGDTAQKPSTANTEDDKKANGEKEHADKQHQHEYKTPTGDQNRNDENQEKNPAGKPAFDADKKQSSQPAAEQKA